MRMATLFRAALVICSLLPSAASESRGGDVSGTIFDDGAVNDTGLSGVSVTVTPKGSSSLPSKNNNADGTYSVKDVPDGPGEITFRKIGFSPAKVTHNYKIANGKATVNARMWKTNANQAYYRRVAANILVRFRQYDDRKTAYAHELGPFMRSPFRPESKWQVASDLEKSEAGIGEAVPFIKTYADSNIRSIRDMQRTCYIGAVNGSGFPDADYFANKSISSSMAADALIWIDNDSRVSEKSKKEFRESFMKKWPKDSKPAELIRIWENPLIDEMKQFEIMKKHAEKELGPGAKIDRP